MAGTRLFMTARIEDVVVVNGKSELLADNRGSAEVKKSEPVILGKRSEMNHRHDVRHWSRSTSKICVANRLPVLAGREFL